MAFDGITIAAIRKELADKLNVSVKTIHDCIKNLSDEGILLSKRGRYGTILMQNPYKKIYEPTKESTIFAKAEDAAFYSYQAYAPRNTSRTPRAQA